MRKIIAVLVLYPLSVFADLPYQKPEEPIDSLLRAPSFSRPHFNEQKTAFVKVFSELSPPMRFVARPKAQLAGVRFFTQNYSQSSNQQMRYTSRLEIFDLRSRKAKPIPFPAGSVIRQVEWSPDGRHLAVSVEGERCHEVWVVNAGNLRREKVSGVCLNAVLFPLVEWINDRELFLGIRTAAQSKPVEVPQEAPKGPVVQESGGKVSQNRTYTDLLKTPADEALFEKAATSQLIRYNIVSHSRKAIGQPGIFAAAEFSPNRKKILVARIERPFSFSVPYYLFSRRTQVWDESGKFLHEVQRSTPFENIPIQGVRTGPREFSWVKNEAQTLFFVEALDQGDWNVKAEKRDEIFLLPVPDRGEPIRASLTRLTHRFSDVHFLDRKGSLLIEEFERDKDWLTTYLFERGSENSWNHRVLFSVGANDDYRKPGDPVFTSNEFHERVLAVDQGGGIFFSGEGATPEGERPFLKRVNLADLSIKEVFRSEKGGYEFFRAFTNKTFTDFYTSFESQKDSPGLYLRAAAHLEQPRQLVDRDPNPYESLTKVRKELITYKRADGVLLSGVLYYPLGYEEGKKYPAILEAYPLEYTDAATAGQVRGSPDRFERPFRAAIVFHALRGYVVLRDAQMPIIGHPETKNDTYVEQLTSGAQAAVDTLTARGLIDPKRVGVIGHSYGAFMVANLLTHSSLFAAGVAESGAYNRTLTPFGFQGERRPFWKAKETYLKMSPFVNVEKLKSPILLLHGMKDSNTGTFPIQSERYFEALKGQGATARLVLLPEEDHGYSALESTEHQLWELFRWFDRYLKPQ